jgi:hypothetical protein
MPGGDHISNVPNDHNRQNPLSTPVVLVYLIQLENVKRSLGSVVARDADRGPRPQLNIIESKSWQSRPQHIVKQGGATSWIPTHHNVYFLNATKRKYESLS